jgi:hypothetical protein
MSNITTQCLLETWQPKPNKSLVGEIPVQEGKILTSSVAEDVMGMSLMSQYSTRQLRKISKNQQKYSESLMINTLANGGSIQW